MWAVCRFLLET